MVRAKATATKTAMAMVRARATATAMETAMTMASVRATVLISMATATVVPSLMLMALLSQVAIRVKYSEKKKRKDFPETDLCIPPYTYAFTMNVFYLKLI